MFALLPLLVLAVLSRAPTLYIRPTYKPRHKTIDPFAPFLTVESWDTLHNATYRRQGCEVENTPSHSKVRFEMWALPSVDFSYSGKMVAPFVSYHHLLKYSEHPLLVRNALLYSGGSQVVPPSAERLGFIMGVSGMFIAPLVTTSYVQSHQYQQITKQDIDTYGQCVKEMVVWVSGRQPPKVTISLTQKSSEQIEPLVRITHIPTVGDAILWRTITSCGAVDTSFQVHVNAHDGLLLHVRAFSIRPHIAHTHHTMKT